jgi:hypothetical protein
MNSAQHFNTIGTAKNKRQQENQHVISAEKASQGTVNKLQSRSLANNVEAL